MMLSSCKKIRYIAMDFKNVKNMDFSCANSFMDINEIIQKMGCQLLIVCLNRKVKIKLQQEGLLDRPGVLTFRDLDHASEYVEDSILYRASFIRLHWLMFDSFRKLHTRALQTASYEIFQSLFGPYIGKRIWRYAERREFKSGEFLFREGDMNPTLFLLQCGKVTSIIETSNGETKRLSAMRRGAFFNEECLFVQRPLSHSSMAEEDSVVWAIDRKSLNLLKINDPFLASEIFRYIMRFSFRRPELNTFEKTAESNDPSEGLGLSIIAQMPCFDLARVDGYETLPSDLSQSLGNLRRAFTPLNGRTDPLMIRPHLSSSMRQDAVDCFLHHSYTAENLDDSVCGAKAALLRRYSSGDLNLPMENNLDPTVKKEITLSGHDLIEEENKNRSINQNELQKALMDLGFFPTVTELQRMRKTLGASMELKSQENVHNNGVYMKDFIGMVEVLSFAKLTLRQRDCLLKLFMDHCDEDFHLRNDTLNSLMRALGHNEDELEIQKLMNEWDVNELGYLDFGTLISIVAHAMKSVKLKSKVQDDFLRLTGRHQLEIRTSKFYLLNTVRPVIVAADIVRTGRNRGMSIDKEIAEEMVFDASESGKDSVELEELIATLETASLLETTQQNVANRATMANKFRSTNQLVTVNNDHEIRGEESILKDFAHTEGE